MTVPPPTSLHTHPQRDLHRRRKRQLLGSLIPKLHDSTTWPIGPSGCSARTHADHRSVHHRSKKKHLSIRSDGDEPAPLPLFSSHASGEPPGGQGCCQLAIACSAIGHAHGGTTNPSPAHLGSDPCSQQRAAASRH